MKQYGINAPTNMAINANGAGSNAINQIAQYQNSLLNGLFNASNASNIDNGKNNTIDGLHNLIKEGDENGVKGNENSVNGSKNSIDGNSNNVNGNSNKIIDSKYLVI